MRLVLTLLVFGACAASEAVLQQTGILSVHVEGEKGVTGAMVRLLDDKDHVVALRSIGLSALTGCRNPDAANIAVRNPGPHRLVVRYSDGHEVVQIKVETPVARRPLADPGVRNYRAGLLENARRWNFDHDGISFHMKLLRGYINLQEFAKRPVACVILSLQDLRSGFAFRGRTECRAVCVRFNHVVSPSIGLQDSLWVHVVNAVSPAIF